MNMLIVDVLFHLCSYIQLTLRVWDTFLYEGNKVSPLSLCILSKFIISYFITLSKVFM